MSHDRGKWPFRFIGRTRRFDFREFFEAEVLGSMVLLAAAIAAIFLANSQWAHAYEEFWHIEVGFDMGVRVFHQSIKHWIDDGLMAIFFFVVGLEIKREMLVGELSTPRKAALPIVAAIGGMMVPAAIYLALNWGTEGARGWGIPMATDIAFAMGVLALLGRRVPAGLKVFLVALAIADDIGAVLVIAVFYTASINWSSLVIGFVFLSVLVLFNNLDIDNPAPYMLVGGVVWLAFLDSGVHATIAGVLIAFTIPATSKIQPMEFVEWTKCKLREIEACDIPGAHVLQDSSQQRLAFQIQARASHMAAPLQRLEHALHPISTFFILPLFALANAGVQLGGEGGFDVSRVALGVALGLLVGKPIGVFLATWLATKMGIAALPSGINWRHIAGAGVLAGIGFTMSLFVTNLAFRENLDLQADAKLAILVASVAAGALGYAFLRSMTKEAGAPLNVADE